MKQYMLDTNVITHLLKNHPNVVKHIHSVPITSLGISAITEAEIFFGLAKRPQAKKLHALIHELLLRVDILPWDHFVSQIYGSLRADLEKAGKLLAPLDLLIAAHALASNRILVTNDQAFQRIPNLLTEDWVLKD